MTTVIGIEELKQLIIQLNKLAVDKQKRLNDFVENKTKILLPEDKLFKENFVSLMDKIAKLAKDIRRKYQPEEFLGEISSLQNEDNAEYIEWLLDYMEKSYGPYADAIPFHKMDMEKFDAMVAFCVQNYILQIVDQDEIPEEWKEREKNLLVLKRIINCYVNWHIGGNHSEYSVKKEMRDTFELSDEHIVIIQKYLKGNEEKLWKMYLLRRLNYIENAIDEINNWIYEQS